MEINLRIADAGELIMENRKENDLHVVECLELPPNPDPNTIYRLLPVLSRQSFYLERTSRNIGWITIEEQEILQRSVVAVAGCGGMGGVGAELLLRAGVGEIRIADPEIFEISNIHRQIAAGINTTGESKAFATAKRIRSISNDTTLVVYPQGVVPETVSHFVRDTDLILDEVEAWAMFPRILLHKVARRQRKSVINCCSIGAGTRLFLFEPDGETIENCLGITYEEARLFNDKFQSGTVTLAEKTRMGTALIKGLLPELPEYMSGDPEVSTIKNLIHRLLVNGQAMILASNPYGSASFMVNHAIFYLLRNSGVARNIIRPISMPGYLFRDDLLGLMKTHQGKWY